MNVEFPFDPVALVLQGLIQAIVFVAQAAWSLPLWPKVVVALLIVVKIKWPWLLQETSPAVRPRRRSRRRNRRDD